MPVTLRCTVTASPSATTSASVRASFTAWLVRHRHQVRGLTVAEMVYRSEVSISAPAAYRCAAALGMRGRRNNHTRYAEFWGELNWSLPDLVLSRIWGVDRGNLRRRRERLHKGKPLFDQARDHGTTSYSSAVEREERKAASYEGPRPC